MRGTGSLGGCLILLVWLGLGLCPPPSAGQEPASGFAFLETGTGLSYHKEMFMLPATYSDAYHGRQTEAVFQLSAKQGILGDRLYFGYTQISFWQAYDYRNSAPFRETNYNPELFYRMRPASLCGGRLGLDAGIEHESNGQPVPLSRSWNLLYAAPYLVRGQWMYYLKLRYRIPEDPKESPLDAIGDDNPDITDYLGHSDIQVRYRYRQKHFWQLILRGFLGNGRGGAGLHYSYPVRSSDAAYFLLRLWYGYGESLADYRSCLFRVGIGFQIVR